MKSQSLLALLGSATLLLAACGQTPSTVAQTTTTNQGLSLTPSPSTVVTLAVNPINLTVGQTYQINVYYGGQPVTPALVTWTSSNTAVATVDQNGLVTATGAGTSNVRVALRSNPAVYLDFTVTVTGAAPAPAPTPTPNPGSGPNAYEQRVLDLTNQARAQARTCGSQSFPAAPPLTYNAALRTAAYNHSRDMAVRGFFDHTNPDGLNPGDRMRNAGYTGAYAWGENIAAGQPTPEAVMSAWLQSPGHCANIMNASFRELGVGYYAGGSYGSYWTQDFGAR